MKPPSKKAETEIKTEPGSFLISLISEVKIMSVVEIIQKFAEVLTAVLEQIKAIFDALTAHFNAEEEEAEEGEG